MKGSTSTGEIPQLPERTPTSVSFLMWPLHDVDFICFCFPFDLIFLHRTPIELLM